MADNKYAGTQTEKNLQEAFAGESQGGYQNVLHGGHRFKKSVSAE